MDIVSLRLKGSYLIKPLPANDDRGYFMRYWDRSESEAHGLTTDWVQENESFNYWRGTLRGLHFQQPPHAETKLVRVVAGAILDVLVDLRKESPTYGQWDSVELSADTRQLLYIPKGFAHGYCTLTDNAVVLYKVDEYYAPGSEGGLRWNDAMLGIRWPIDSPKLSEKDQALPTFDKFTTPF